MSTSSSSHPRVSRSSPPAKKLKRHSYRDALPELRRDFEDRCAYSMQHILRAGGLKAMEVDHFDPRRKNDYIQDYQNLFLATRHCNGAKRDNWPTAKEDAEGYRFLNCCEERDYGVHLFEDPHTHKIKWTTRAGGYHAIHCDLDAPHLVEERRQRAELLHLLHETPVLAKQSPPELLACLEKIREQLKLMIPEIPAPPKQATGLPD